MVDEWILVSEDQIADAMRSYMAREGHTIEGAAGVAIAAMIELRDEIAGKNIVVVVCGSNVSDETLDRVRGIESKV